MISAIMSGHDVLAMMPTGAGKSICYQVPALILPGITLVISPLIALMQDQVQSLREAGAPAAYINSTLTEGQIRKALSNAREGAYKIIYVAPERLQTESFLRFALQADISMVTVDEAHCISQWGQDFRPSYLEIASFTEQLRKRPVISAFTATATDAVREDMVQLLKLTDPEILKMGADRPNLFFSVCYPGNKLDFVLRYVREHDGESGLIYCATRNGVNDVHEALIRQGIAAVRYHAGLTTEERQKSQSDFVYDRVSVCVATNAFGMGIDKSNVRYVLHYNMPQNMESYYQEAGRAGRDGEESECILLYSYQDVKIAETLLEHKEMSQLTPEEQENIRMRDAERLRAMRHYCRTTECLRGSILRYFGEHPPLRCGNCGNCLQKVEERDMTDAAKWVLNCVTETRGRYGAAIISGILTGGDTARLEEVGAKKYRSYGKLREEKQNVLRLLIDQMVEEGFLEVAGGDYPVLRLAEEGVKRLRKPDTRVVVRIPERQNNAKMVSAEKYRAGSNGREKEEGLFSALRQERLRLSRERKIPPYMVFSDRTLVDMCVVRPHTRLEMRCVSGVGEKKMAEYGEIFLNVIREYEKSQ